MRAAARDGALGRAKAWLVTGPVGRGASFAIDFAVVLRDYLRGRLHEKS